MTHSLCRSDADGMLSYFQRLGRTLFAPNIEPRARLEQLLQHESAEFNLSCAFLSQVDLKNETERFEIAHGSHELLKPDTTVPLSKTYCRKTITGPEGTLAVSDALAEGWKDDLAYETFGFESYIGTRVWVAEELYGMLCFADTAARDHPFIDEEKALVEMYGQWVGYMLTLSGETSIQEARVDTIERGTVSSEDIDSMMDALKTQTRRGLLMALLGDTTETSIATLERRLDHESDRIRMFHSHLPKLTDSGYINWDIDANTISKGPKFWEVKPLVQLLKEYETASLE